MSLGRPLTAYFCVRSLSAEVLALALVLLGGSSWTSFLFDYLVFWAASLGLLRLTGGGVPEGVDWAERELAQGGRGRGPPRR